ncbi:MAG: nucleoside recognition protein [Clostridiales bacterium]|nr:nucleoside recognition protein [Clostridiales bacterium]
MLNFLWAGMIFLGILTAAFSGNLEAVTNGAIDSAKEAVNVVIVMVGVLSMWTGLMKIGEKSGLIELMAEKIMPFLKFLFPDVPRDHKAMKHIAVNVIANMLGLGWAATPAGLLAMKELQKLNPEKDKASRAMCIFMVFNMSSLQLVSVNIIAYRSQFNSANPSEIIGPGLFATLVSTITGIAVIKIIEMRYGKCRY